MSESSRKDFVYAFIDSQNLNLGTSCNLKRDGKTYYYGWSLDFKKFYIYIKNKFRVSKAFLFLGYIHEYEHLYKYLRTCGYILVFKPTVKNRYGKPKGNIDAEIVLHATRLVYDEYSKAVFVSGDGDFYCLYKFLVAEKKPHAIIIPNKYTGSSLLNEFEEYKRFIYRDRDKLEKKDGRRRLLSRR